MDLNPNRVAWVDHAKGFCIVIVVMRHAPLGGEAAAGVTSWMGALVAFAKPFRMPDFVIIFGGYSELPVVNLGLGFLGVGAVVAASVLLSARRWALPLRYAGENSIVVYLAFILPM